MKINRFSQINYIMRKGLIEYLHEHERKFLFLHPQFLGPHNIIAFLISLPQFIGKYITIITNDKDKINKCLPNSLTDEGYMRYDQFIKNVNINAEYLIIDDYQLYCKYELDNFIKDNKIDITTIILTKGNIKIEKDMKVLHLDLCEDGAILKHDLIVLDKKDYVKKITTEALLRVNSKHLITGKKDEFEVLSKFTDMIFADEAVTLQDICNIEFIHFNKIKLEYYLKLVNIFYKRQLLKDCIDVFTIIFYIDDKNKTEVDQYNDIINYIEEYQKEYTALLEIAIKLKYDDDIGVYIEN